MALQFLTNAPAEDAELVIALDLEGLHTLLKVIMTALEAKLDQLALEGGGANAAAGGEASNPFGKVTVRFLDPPPEAPAETRLS